MRFLIIRDRAGGFGPRDAVGAADLVAEFQQGYLSLVRYVDTEPFTAKRGHQLGLEGALVYGPFSVQTEYMVAFSFSAGDVVKFDPHLTQAIEDATFWGVYAMVSYFVTGEHRPYSQANAVFTRPIPQHNFLQGGAGAWELAFRFSYIDLDDAASFGPDPSRGGREWNYTVGVNWYLNPNTRITTNYVLAVVDDRVVNGILIDTNTVGIFEMRFQVAF